MPKLSKNAFINKHQAGVAVVLQFPDFRPGSKEASTGKDFPTPNRVTIALAKSIQGDFTLISNGKVQIVGFPDLAEAQKFADRFVHGAPQRLGVEPPWRVSIGCVINGEQYVRAAKVLGLL